MERLPWTNLQGSRFLMQPHTFATDPRIPPSLTKVFIGQKIMAQTIKTLQGMAGEVKSWTFEPYAGKLDVEMALAHLQEAQNVILRSMPFCPCGCVANRNECKLCGGSGWLNFIEYQRVSDRALESPLPEFSRTEAA